MLGAPALGAAALSAPWSREHRDDAAVREADGRGGHEGGKENRVDVEFRSRRVEDAPIRSQLVKRYDGAKPLMAHVGRCLGAGRGTLRVWVPSDSYVQLPEVLDDGGISPSGSQQEPQQEFC